MNEKDQTRRPTEEAEAAIEREVALGVKEEIVDIYEDLFETIWNRIVPTLGTVTVMTIMQRAIYRTRHHYAILKHLTVTEEGLDFTTLRTQMEEKDKEVLKDGFKELVANLFDILAKLTGNVLVNQLMAVIEGKV